MLPITASSISGSRAASAAACSRLTLAAMSCASPWFAPSPPECGTGPRAWRPVPGSHWRLAAGLLRWAAGCCYAPRCCASKRSCVAEPRVEQGMARMGRSRPWSGVGAAVVVALAGSRSTSMGRRTNRRRDSSRRPISSVRLARNHSPRGSSSARLKPSASSARGPIGDGRRRKWLPALCQTGLLVGGRALAHGVGAIAPAQPAFQPQRARQIGNGLRRHSLLSVGDATIEQRLGHDCRRQVAAGEHRAQRLDRRLRLARLDQLRRRFDGTLGLGRVLSLFLGRCRLGGGVAILVGRVLSLRRLGFSLRRLLGLGLLGRRLGGLLGRNARDARRSDGCRDQYRQSQPAPIPSHILAFPRRRRVERENTSRHTS